MPITANKAEEIQNRHQQEKIQKLLSEELSDSCNEAQTEVYYEKFDPQVVIIENLDSELFSIKRVSDGHLLNQAERETWLREKLRPAIPIAPPSQNVKSLNFAFTKENYKALKQSETILSNEKKVAIANRMMQTINPQISDLNEEEFLEYTYAHEFAFSYCKQIGIQRKIKFREQSIEAMKHEVSEKTLKRQLKKIKTETKNGAHPKLEKFNLNDLSKEDKQLYKFMKTMGKDWDNITERERYRKMIGEL